MALDFLGSVAKPIEDSEHLAQLSLAVMHPWHLLQPQLGALQTVLAWQEQTDSGHTVWSALIEWPALEQPGAQAQVLKIRGLDNQLAQAKQLSDLHLWLLQQLPKAD